MTAVLQAVVLHAVAAALALAALAPAPADARRLPGEQVAQHLVSVALREWRDWGRTVVDGMDGGSRVVHQGARETDTRWTDKGRTSREPFDASARVRRYWAEGVGAPGLGGGVDEAAADEAAAGRDAAGRAAAGRDAAGRDAAGRGAAGRGAAGRGAAGRDAAGQGAAVEDVSRNDGASASPRTPPWSAAFVSWLMREVGVSAPAFVADAAHAGYLRALHARQGADEAQFDLLLAEDEPLKVGDLVCGPRNVSGLADRVTLLRMGELDDLERLTSSHCDLVVDVLQRLREARVIGGNVADSVAMTRLPLTREGRAIRTLSRPWFVIVRAR